MIVGLECHTTMVGHDDSTLSYGTQDLFHWFDFK